MEPTEVSEFTEKMEEIGAKHERNMMRVSLIISLLAAMVATVTVLAHREHTEAVLLQSHAGNQWNDFQSHKMRLAEAQTAGDVLTLLPSSDPSKVLAKLAEYKKQTDKLQSQIVEDAKQAKDYQAQVDVAEKKAGRFDLGEALLEIAVVLASITLLTRHQRYAVVGCVLGGVGAVAVISAFMLH